MKKSALILIISFIVVGCGETTQPTQQEQNINSVKNELAYLRSSIRIIEANQTKIMEYINQSNVSRQDVVISPQVIEKHVTHRVIHEQAPVITYTDTTNNSLKNPTIQTPSFPVQTTSPEQSVKKDETGLGVGEFVAGAATGAILAHIATKSLEKNKDNPSVIAAKQKAIIIRDTAKSKLSLVKPAAGNFLNKFRKKK